jgi:hypothetical protein
MCRMLEVYRRFGESTSSFFRIVNYEVKINQNKKRQALCLTYKYFSIFDDILVRVNLELELYLYF